MFFVTLACLQLHILLRGLVQTNGQREVRTEELTVKITDTEFENPPPLPRPCSPLITPSHHTSFLEFTRFPSLSFNTPLSLSHCCHCFYMSPFRSPLFQRRLAGPQRSRRGEKYWIGWLLQHRWKHKDTLIYGICGAMRTPCARVE